MEVEEDVVVDAAVDVVEKVESIASAAKDQKASVVNALNVARGQKVIVHPDRKEMLLPAVEVTVVAVAVEVIAEVIAEVEEEEGVASRSSA